MPLADEVVVDFPTLWVVPAWIEAHCPVPDGFHRGKPLELPTWQLWCTVNHYRVKRTAEWRPENPLKASAFHYRRSQIVGPQKCGKGPWSSTIVSNEAVGPSLFGGWAEPGEGYACSEHGCGCGWEYEYESGEPKGIPHPTPLIQLTATSEDQVQSNVYRHLKAMIALGPLGDLMRVAEGFVALPNDGRIDVVTASANSRLGNPVSFVLDDETGLYTKSNKLKAVAEAQRRGAAGMAGRTMETTNCWDPSEASVAQDTYEASAPDVFKYYRKPPAGLDYNDPADRRKIHAFNYEDLPWIEPDAIEGEAAELAEKDPAQAARFFGNLLVAGAGTWLPDGLWDSLQRTHTRRGPTVRRRQQRLAVCGGFDGSDNNDWTGIRLETVDGWQFTPTYGPDDRPAWWDPAKAPKHKIPRGEVRAAIDHIFRTYKVERLYCDPHLWSTEIEEWAVEYGEEHVIQWDTGRGLMRLQPMFEALERFRTDCDDERITHDGCPTTSLHMTNARMVAKPQDRYVLGKPSEHQKIDLAMCSVLAHEAASDARLAGWKVEEPAKTIVFS